MAETDKKKRITGGKVGRPTKAQVKLQEQREVRSEKEANETALASLPPVYKCTRCGKTTTIPDGNFYIINYNDALDGNEKRTHICIECTKRYFQEYGDKFNDEKLALMLTCMQIGAYFSEELYEILHKKELDDPDKDPFVLGKYLRMLSGPKYRKQSFISYLLSIMQKKNAFNSKETQPYRTEAGWGTADRRNKEMCESLIGYDCFDDGIYTPEDRRRMYSSLAQYLAAEDISEDKHKRDVVISIVKTSMQMEFLDKELNLASRSPEPDFAKIDRLIGAKKELNSVINQLAKENAISTGSSVRKTKAASAVTAVMKEMIDNGVVEAKVNLTDVKMTEVFRHISAISAKALVNEMNISGDEYAVMVAKQSDTIRSLNDKVMELEEKNRLLTVQIHRIEHPEQYREHEVDLDIGAALRWKEEPENEFSQEFDSLPQADSPDDVINIVSDESGCEEGNRGIMLGEEAEE